LYNYKVCRGRERFGEGNLKKRGRRGGRRFGRGGRRSQELPGGRGMKRRREKAGSRREKEDSD
jgi:hypothetical protein